MIEYRHEIHRGGTSQSITTQQLTVLGNKQEVREYKDIDFHFFNFIIDIILLTLIACLFYYALRSRVTGAAMIASRSVWYRSLPVFIFALLFALPMMGVTLGAIISRQLLGRNVTVDWYSVIGGTLLTVVIYYIPYINLICLSLLYILTFVALIQSYIIKE